jgi:hypothetical protein
MDIDIPPFVVYDEDPMYTNRKSELVELYQEFGFEVMLRPVSAEDADGTCAVCVMDDPERYKTIYTRPALVNG